MHTGLVQLQACKCPSTSTGEMHGSRAPQIEGLAHLLPNGLKHLALHIVVCGQAQLLFQKGGQSSGILSARGREAGQMC